MEITLIDVEIAPSFCIVIIRFEKKIYMGHANMNSILKIEYLASLSQHSINLKQNFIFHVLQMKASKKMALLKCQSTGSQE